MYIHLIYYPGDRSVIDSIVTQGIPGMIGNRTFILNAVDNDVDALRFYLPDGIHFDVFFLDGECSGSVYEEVLKALRENRSLVDLDIRDLQVALPPCRRSAGD